MLLVSREVLVCWRSLHILRHISLLIKRHYICPYLLCTVNQWAENSSQELVFVVVCHGKWARVLDAPSDWEPRYCTACQAFILLVNWRPGQLKCKNCMSQKTEDAEYSRKDPRGIQPDVGTRRIYFMFTESHLDWDLSKFSCLLHRQFSFSPFSYTFSYGSSAPCLITGWGI